MPRPTRWSRLGGRTRAALLGAAALLIASALLYLVTGSLGWLLAWIAALLLMRVVAAIAVAATRPRRR